MMAVIADPPAYPSLEQIEAEVERSREEQQKRNEALDAKAGTLLGFSGVLIGLAVGRSHSLWSLSGVIADGFAAVAAGIVHVAFGYPEIGNLPRLRPRYREPPEQTRLALVDTKIELYEPREKLLRTKAWLVTASALLLMLAVVLQATGIAVAQLRG